jgi:hypothetical protein
LPANTLLWPQRWPAFPSVPWIVFCSPPYSFYIEHAAEMFALLTGLIDRAPAGSLFCVEADEQFDFAQLPDPTQWDVRVYPPAHMGIWEKPAGKPATG